MSKKSDSNVNFFRCFKYSPETRPFKNIKPTLTAEIGDFFPFFMNLFRQAEILFAVDLILLVKRT